MAGLTLAEASARIIAEDPLFALGEGDVQGVTLPVFANAPSTLRGLMRFGESARQAEDFLVFEGERLSYAAYCDQANRISRILTERLGVMPGDRVAIAMRNYPEFLTLFMGVVNTGAVAVLLNAWWTTEELDYAFADSGARLVFADGPRAERIAPLVERRGLTLVGARDADMAQTLEGLLAETPVADWPDTPIDPDDDFGVMYSSGSTGRPKGVALTHRGATTAVFSWMLSLRLPPLMAPAGTPMPPPRPPVVLCATPLFHVTASHPVYLTAIASGATLVLIRKWDGEAALRLINEESVTRFIGVPTMTADLAEASRRLGVGAPTLEQLSSGGAKRPAAQVAEQAEVFPTTTVASGWGMTETNALGLGIAGPDYLARPEQGGRLYPPLQALKIVGPNGEALPPGEVGELAVRSAANMRCYINKPEETAAALQDGWLMTGDLAHVDADGYVTFVDRKKSIIIRGGENISCLEVEGALHRLPEVMEAAAFSAPHDRLGETVGACVTPRPGASIDAAALTEALSGALAAFKIPERLWVTDQPLPRGATDKIDRRGIRDACLAGELGRALL